MPLILWFIISILIASDSLTNIVRIKQLSIVLLVVFVLFYTILSLLDFGALPEPTKTSKRSREKITPDL